MNYGGEDWLKEWGMQGRGGHRGKNWDNYESTINRIYFKKWQSEKIRTLDQREDRMVFLIKKPLKPMLFLMDKRETI